MRRKRSSPSQTGEKSDAVSSKLAKPADSEATSKYFTASSTDSKDETCGEDTKLNLSIAAHSQSESSVNCHAGQKNCLIKLTGSPISGEGSALGIDHASSDGPLLNREHLDCTFYDQPCVTLARALLGKKLVHKLADGTLLSGMIVETEAYPGSEDVASHSYNGRRTERNEAMYMPPGTAYVYNIYGMYCCMNISSQGDGAAVLLRALNPVNGHEVMRRRRGARRSDGGAKLKDHELCNGPSKLADAFGINKGNSNKLDLLSSDKLWLEDGDKIEEENIVTSTRIGIDSYGQEWAGKPWRFYIFGDKSVSKRDKKAEPVPGSS